jgi:hypothetical protein
MIRRGRRERRAGGNASVLEVAGHENVETTTQCSPHAKFIVDVLREDCVTCAGRPTSAPCPGCFRS